MKTKLFKNVFLTGSVLFTALPAIPLLVSCGQTGVVVDGATYVEAESYVEVGDYALIKLEPLKGTAIYEILEVKIDNVATDQYLYVSSEKIVTISADVVKSKNIYIKVKSGPYTPVKTFYPLLWDGSFKYEGYTVHEQPQDYTYDSEGKNKIKFQIDVYDETIAKDITGNFVMYDIEGNKVYEQSIDLKKSETNTFEIEVTKEMWNNIPWQPDLTDPNSWALLTCYLETTPRELTIVPDKASFTEAGLILDVCPTKTFDAYRQNKIERIQVLNHSGATISGYIILKSEDTFLDKQHISPQPDFRSYFDFDDVPLKKVQDGKSIDLYFATKEIEVEFTNNVPTLQDPTYPTSVDRFDIAGRFGGSNSDHDNPLTFNVDIKDQDGNLLMTKAMTIDPNTAHQEDIYFDENIFWNVSKVIIEYNPAE